MLGRWSSRCFLRAAYRSSGIGIVERHHYTIKAVAEKRRISPMEGGISWYSMLLRVGQTEESVLHRVIFRYKWRHPSRGSKMWKGLHLYRLEIKCRWNLWTLGAQRRREKERWQQSIFGMVNQWMECCVTSWIFKWWSGLPMTKGRSRDPTVISKGASSPTHGDGWLRNRRGGTLIFKPVW